jgi:hypothetical protein
MMHVLIENTQMTLQMWFTGCVMFYLAGLSCRQTKTEEVLKLGWRNWRWWSGRHTQDLMVGLLGCSGLLAKVFVYCFSLTFGSAPVKIAALPGSSDFCDNEA